MITIDGTFLKGKYKGTLLTASAQDANQQIFPLAFSVVDTENIESWKWFLQQLALQIPSTSDLAFVSDRSSSIAKAIAIVYPSATHYICNWHLKQNLKVQFRKESLLELFKKAYESYTVAEFNKYFDSICSINKNMGTYLMRAGIEKWARAHASTHRYNMMTSNNAESINSALRGCRWYPIVELLKYIREMMSKWFTDRRNDALNNCHELPSKLTLIIEEKCKQSGRYKVNPLNDYQLEVVGGQNAVIVDLMEKSCSCRFFDLEKIPCVHAIAAVIHKGLNIKNYVGSFYTNESWYLAYHETIYPELSQSEWDVPEEVKMQLCYPPIVRNQSGRKRIKRIRSLGEFKRRRPRHCRFCGSSAHTATTCKTTKALSR